MKQYKYEVFINNVIAFTDEGSWEAVKSVRDFIANRMTASFTLAVTANNKTVVSKGEDYPTWNGGIGETIKSRMIDMLWQSAQSTPMHSAKVGDKGKSTITLNGIGLSWECTSGRAPARPKHVIAAEKAAKDAKLQARRERQARWKKEEAERIVNTRRRIKHQVDHAFALGKHGTEPAAKYITCQHCDAPADVLCLSRALTRGAAVLDEDTIVGALCANHSQHSYYGSKAAEKVPCARLEFFYDGVRQIAIKA